MPIGNLNVGVPKQISASANCLPSDGGMLGILVTAASNTPTITVYDSATTTTALKLVDTFTPVAGTWYPIPITCTAGIYVVISGTVSCTVVTAP